MRVARRLSAVTLVLMAAALPPAAAAPAPVTALPAGALVDVGAATSFRTSSYGGGNWANPDPVALLPVAGGGLEVVRSDDTADRLLVDELTGDTLRPVRSRTVSLAGWPLWGGVQAGPDGSRYVLVGRSNPDELDDRDVVQVRRYDRDWTLLGTAHVKGGATQGFKGVYEPFDAGSPHLLLDGDRLVVHMSRTMYRSPRDGLRHQSNLTFEVDVRTMTAATLEELGGDTPYSSHSFQQLVARRGGDLVLVDHGDAFPRSLQVSVVAGWPTSRAVVRHRFFPFTGAVGDNFTGASVTDVVTGPGGVVVLGSSVRQPPGTSSAEAVRRSERRNLFAARLLPDGTSEVRWLTAFAPDGAEGVGEARAVPVGQDRSAVLFSVVGDEGSRLEYRLLDSAGTVHASASFPAVPYPTVSQPLLLGSTLHWAGPSARADGTTDRLHLYGLDLRDPAQPVLDPRAPKAFARVPVPAVEGPPRVGSTLTARPGAWEPAPAWSYRWFADGALLPGADQPTLTLTDALRGRAVTVEVTGTLSGYNTTSVTSAPTARVTEPPSLRLALDRLQVGTGSAAQVTLTGVPGAVVDLLGRPYPSTSATRLRQGLVLGSDGTARVTLRPDRSLHLSASDRTHDVSAAEQLLQVRGSTTLGSVTRTGTRRYVLAGTARPAHPGKVVDLYRNGVRVARVAVAASGAYRFDRVLPAGGATYDVRAPGTGHSLASSSPRRYVAVR